ncbi:MAG TPA: YihY/virulence factor BrkB family protein [Candidatus Baltobacteraceae bacterium]|jgi:membrane protein
MVFRSVIEVVVDTFRDWQRHRTSQMAAQLALYLGFAIMALLVIAIFAAGSIYAGAGFHARIDAALLQLAGPQTAATARAFLRAAGKPGVAIFAVIGASAYLMFLVVAVSLQLQSALNVIWETKSKGTTEISNAVRARVAPFVAIFGLALALLVVLFVGGALHAVNTYTSTLHNTAAHVFQALNVLVTMVLLAVTFTVIYGYLPRPAVPWRDVAAGAILAAILFERGQFFFALYLGKMNIRSPYADAGALLDFWLWLYYSAEVILIGAEFARVLQRRSKGAEG